MPGTLTTSKDSGEVTTKSSSHTSRTSATRSKAIPEVTSLSTKSQDTEVSPAGMPQEATTSPSRTARETPFRSRSAQRSPAVSANGRLLLRNNFKSPILHFHSS